MIISFLVSRLYYQQKILSEIKAENLEKTSKLNTQEDLVRTLIIRKNELKNDQKELYTRADEYKQNAQNLRIELDQKSNKLINLESNINEQRIKLNAEKEKISELKLQFITQKNELKTEFKVMSTEIIKERQKEINEKNHEGINLLIAPLSQQITSFQKRVNEVHFDIIKGNSSLEAEVKKITDIGINLREEANNLASSLKGNPQQRGAWGEAQLERTLEMSGLIKDAHYGKHSSFKDESGNNKQTDYLIKLPDNKHIIIDSKVSLIAYNNASSSKLETERITAMNSHVKSIEKHIDQLAEKDYTNLVGMQSPNFVLMFMPIEPAYIAALQHSKELFNYGYHKNIVLVSHTTLIPILRTISNLWMLDKSNHEAQNISKKAGDIYNSVCTVAERFQKLGVTLNTASTHYNLVVKSISGQQGLQKKVEEFTHLSNKISKKMPEITDKHILYESSQIDIKPIKMAN